MTELNTHHVCHLMVLFLITPQFLLSGTVLPERLQARPLPKPFARVQRAEPLPPVHVHGAGAGRGGGGLGVRVRLQDQIVEHR